MISFTLSLSLYALVHTLAFSLLHVVDAWPANKGWTREGSTCSLGPCERSASYCALFPLSSQERVHSLQCFLSTFLRGRSVEELSDVNTSKINAAR